ncbi:hypothetical protein DL93DRAFT_2049957 [Clavulina sp. PMI_390]|nr:hypothetical protein DL93DRAFT_2049957 [Clavulina sp. PMI_390]
MPSSSFPALPHVYQFIFLYFEPNLTFMPVLSAWVFPGTAWFHHQLVPSTAPPPSMIQARETMAIWQLVNCYLLLALLGNLILRAARDHLGAKDQLRAQEKIVKAYIISLAICDLNHISLFSVGATWICLPEELRNPLLWNPMTHGNITATFALFVAR